LAGVRSLVRAFAGSGPGGVLARRLLPAALLAPPLFAALALLGEAAGLLGARLGLALMTLATMLFLVLVVGRTVRSLEQAGHARGEAETSLRLSEERFRLLVQGAWDYAIFMLAARGWVASWNLGAERVTGYAPGEILGRDYRVLFTEQDRADGEPERILERAAASGHAEVGIVCVRKDGTRIWAHAAITALRHQDGRLRGFVMVTRDVTERRRAEQAIRQLNGELRALLRRGPRPGRRLRPRCEQLRRQAGRHRPVLRRDPAARLLLDGAEPARTPPAGRTAVGPRWNTPSPRPVRPGGDREGSGTP
jgi:PAS domain S-box-containing protein